MIPIVHGLATTILKRQIPLGQSRLPLGLMLVFGVCLAVAVCLNGIYFRQYSRIMAYLLSHHPDIYETVRRKPSIGSFYSKTYNPSKALIALAQQAHPGDDPQLQTLLRNFVRFDKTFWLICTIAIGMMSLTVLVVGILLSA